MVRLAQSAINRMPRISFQSPGLALSFFDAHSHGDMSRFTNDAEQVR